MKTELNNLLTTILLLVLSLGVVCLVLQNFGIIPTTQRVFVVNEIEASIDGGHIDYINGGEINVSGSVDVDNTVDAYIVGGEVGIWQ